MLTKFVFILNIYPLSHFYIDISIFLLRQTKKAPLVSKSEAK